MLERFGRRPPVPLVALVLMLPAVIKLFFLQAEKVFEPHTVAMEWIASGHFRYAYLGSWDHAFQFPVYTALIALIHLCGLGDMAVLLFQVACGTSTAYLVLRLARVVLHGRPYAERVGLAAALVTGMSPFLAFYQVRMIHPFAWDMVLAMALLYAALSTGLQRKGPLCALFLLGGLVMFNRPTLIVFLLPFILREWRYLFGFRQLGFKLLLLLFLTIPLGAWVVRNRAVTGQFQLTSVTDQLRWMGLQEETEGSGQLPNGDSYMYLLSVPERHQLFAMDPGERSRFFRAKWQAECAADPGLRWHMFAVKLKNFWLYRSNLGMDHGVPAWAVVCFKAYGIVLLVLVLSIFLLRDGRWFPTLLSVACLSVLQCTFYFETRHRLLAEPVLMLVALAALAGWRERWQAWRSRS